MTTREEIRREVLEEAARIVVEFAADRLKLIASVEPVVALMHTEVVAALREAANAIRAAISAPQPGPADAGPGDVGQTSDLYLVWSNEHRAWWQAYGCGYTTDLMRAGRFIRDEALSISHNCRDGWRHSSERPTELAIRVADLPAVLLSDAPAPPDAGSER